MKSKILTILALSLVIFLSLSAVANARQQPVVGRKAAEKYFQEDQKVIGATSSTDNVLMLHVGKFVNSQAYDWGSPSNLSDTGQAIYGLTYLFDYWHGMDLNIRADFHEFSVFDQRAVKLALMPLWTFPRAETRFPLYFGIGAGMGIFLQQVTNKSNLSLDYQLVMGARFMDITPGFGAFVEYGLKNHLHVLTSGQFNGTAFAGGLVFNF